MTNEIIFIIHTFCVSIFTIGAAIIGTQALIVITIVHCILANIFVTKQVNLFFFAATGTDAFIIGSVLGLNLLQEYGGSQIARKTIFINFFALCYVICASIIQLWYIPNNFDDTHAAFAHILSPLPRIGFVSVVVFFIEQYCDYLFFQFLKRLFNDNYFVLRNFISTALCQLLDTVLFTYFALSGIVENLFEVGLMSYSVKLLAIFVISPMVFLGQKTILKKIKSD